MTLLSTNHTHRIELGAEGKCAEAHPRGNNIAIYFQRAERIVYNVSR